MLISSKIPACHHHTGTLRSLGDPRVGLSIATNHAGTRGQSWSKLQPRNEHKPATPRTFLPGNRAVGPYFAPPAHLLTSSGEAAHRAHSSEARPDPRARSPPRAPGLATQELSSYLRPQGAVGFAGMLTQLRHGSSGCRCYLGIRHLRLQSPSRTSSEPAPRTPADTEPWDGDTSRACPSPHPTAGGRGLGSCHRQGFLPQPPPMQGKTLRSGSSALPALLPAPQNTKGNKERFKQKAKSIPRRNVLGLNAL